MRSNRRGFVAHEVYASGPLGKSFCKLKSFEDRSSTTGPLPPQDVPADLPTQDVPANPAEIVSGSRQHGPLARSGRACNSCRDCSAVEQHSRPPQQCCRFLLDRRQVSHSSAAAAAAAAASSDAGPTRAIGCWTDSPARTARRPSTRAVSHSCSRLLGSCWTAVTPAAAALQAAPAHSVPAGPTAPPGQLAAQLVLVESRQNSSRPRPCSQTLRSSTPGRNWFLLDRQPRQDSSPPKHPGSHSLLQQHSRTRASSSWTDSPRLGRTPNGGAVGDLQKPAEDREAREEEAGSFGLMPPHK